MGEPGKDNVEDIIAVWSERTGREISREGARQMAANVCGFFEVLKEWDRRAREEDGTPPRARAVPGHTNGARQQGKRG